MNPPTDIRSWLEGIGLGEHAQVFEDHQITPEVLPSLTADDLRELGVTLMGQRKKLETAIAALSQPAGPDAPTAQPPAEIAPSRWLGANGN